MNVAKLCLYYHPYYAALENCAVYRLLRPIFVNQALPNYGEMAANLDKNASGDGAEEFVMLKDDPK